MSLTYKNTGYPIANDLATDEVIFFEESPNEIKTKEAIGNFDILPNIKNGFEVVYMCGAMGVGKSTQCRMYAQEYRRIFRKNNIFLFSQKMEDKAFDDYHELKIRRVKLDDIFMKKTFDVTKERDFHNSLILFDDIATIPEKKMVEKVLQIILQFITLGRQYHCYIVITSHMFYGFKNKELYANIQNEVNKLIWFKGVNTYQLKYILKQYWGYDVRQINRFLKMDPESRFTCINKYPAYIITKHSCLLI